MTENDREIMRLTVEQAVYKGITEALKTVEIETEEACKVRISVHKDTCPWGLDYDKKKSQFLGFVIGAAFGGGGIGAGLVTVLTRIL